MSFHSIYLYLYPYTEKYNRERLMIGINMNAGQRINLRLRPPGSPSDFYEFDQLVLVMLHEVRFLFASSFLRYLVLSPFALITYCDITGHADDLAHAYPAWPSRCFFLQITSRVGRGILRIKKERIFRYVFCPPFILFIYTMPHSVGPKHNIANPQEKDSILQVTISPD